MSANNINMSGNATIIARNVRADGGSSVVACGNLTLRDNARIEDHNGWGGDGGAIGIGFLKLYDDSSVLCEGSYADICGGCVSADIVLACNASVARRSKAARCVASTLNRT
jgi:hypothetical protein